MIENLSPEEILRKKEILGGVIYDDDIQNLPPENSNSTSPKLEEIPNTIPQNPVEPVFKIENGWKNLPINILPSKGLFYPENTQIAIKPADVKEIRHFSTIDEGDVTDINSKLNIILDACCKIKFTNEGVVDYRDLKQEDRFFVILAIRDLTFVKGENRIILKPKGGCNKNGCEIKHPIELRTGVLSNYSLDTKLMKFYSREKNKFIFPMKKTNKFLEMSIPSIGVVENISKFVRNSVRANLDVDESFMKIAPFIFDEWRDLTDDKIRKVMIESENLWSVDEFSVFFEMSQLIKLGTQLEVKIPCEICGEGEVTAPITFQRGFRSLFIVSDIFGELLRY